jgi:hypothetical protein
MGEFLREFIFEKYLLLSCDGMPCTVVQIYQLLEKTATCIFYLETADSWFPQNAVSLQ